MNILILVGKNPDTNKNIIVSKSLRSVLKKYPDAIISLNYTRGARGVVKIIARYAQQIHLYVHSINDISVETFTALDGHTGTTISILSNMTFGKYQSFILKMADSIVVVDEDDPLYAIAKRMGKNIWIPRKD